MGRPVFDAFPMRQWSTVSSFSPLDFSDIVRLCISVTICTKDNLWQNGQSLQFEWIRYEWRNKVLLVLSHWQNTDMSWICLCCLHLLLLYIFPILHQNLWLLRGKLLGKSCKRSGTLELDLAMPDISGHCFSNFFFPWDGFLQNCQTSGENLWIPTNLKNMHLWL